MNRAIMLAFLILLVWMQSFLQEPAVAGEQPATIAFTPGDRVMILAPHPDDEVLACGGVIQHCVATGIPVRVVFLTYGDDNELSFMAYRRHPVLSTKSVLKMGLVRRDEAITAARTLGLNQTNLVFLGYPDFGTLRIWYAHWGSEPPLRGFLTAAKAVPYKSAFRPGSAFKGEEILKDLSAIIRDFKPTRIFVSHPADHNPDHQALYLFTRIALWNLETELKPEIYPYLVHFRNWPKQKDDDPEFYLSPPPSLSDDIEWQNVLLQHKQVERKIEALEAHKSQCKYASRFLHSFARPNELFGDFASLPPPGPQIEAGGNIHESHSSVMPPDELNEEERSEFVGIQARHMEVEGSDLLTTMDFTRPMGRTVGATLYVSGYRTNRPFGRMPKVRIRIGETSVSTFDQKTRLPEDSVSVSRSAGRITVRIPLDTLGNPEQIITSVQTYIGPVPLDWAPWRTLKIHRHPSSLASAGQ